MSLGPNPASPVPLRHDMPHNDPDLSPDDRRKWEALGQILVSRGVLTPEQLAAAVEHQRRNRQRLQRLGKVLLDLKLVTEAALLEALALQFEKALMDPRELANLAPEVVRILPEETARKNTVIAVERSARRLVIAIADPLNVLALDEVRRVAGLEIDFRIATAAAIQSAIQRYYRPPGSEAADEVLRQDLGITVVSNTTPEESVDIKQLRTEADDPPVVKIVNHVLTRAAVDGASDIHIEPYDDRTAIRYRVDGLLYDMLDVPKPMHLAVVSRLKILSRLDIAERRLPQDGSFSVRVHDTEIDFRVSTLPMIHGEKIVLRLLLKEAVAKHYTLEGLGFDVDQLPLFQEAIRRPWGMILMTGPTGSGKSTTLHTALKAIKSPRKNIITVEDPVEYRQAGINQVQVKTEIGFDFARSLRAILRQDPDIIMVGEIRDQETAQIAVRAALTGHLVFSTLHANDAVSTVTRLVNLGVEPFLVASAVNLAAAQRLVRKICPDCRETYEPTPDDRVVLADECPKVLYRGRGCARCRSTGFAGRLALFELLPITPEIRATILSAGAGDEIQKQALQGGMITLRESGLRKVHQGITTVEEVLAVVADQE
jgi:type IV pilus assembly protein PilB